MIGPHRYQANRPYPEPEERIELGIRVPLPERVRVRDDRDRHLDGASCLLLTYREWEKQSLIDTLEQAIEGIRRGPRP